MQIWKQVHALHSCIANSLNVTKMEVNYRKLNCDCRDFVGFAPFWPLLVAPMCVPVRFHHLLHWLPLSSPVLALQHTLNILRQTGGLGISIAGGKGSTPYKGDDEVRSGRQRSFLFSFRPCILWRTDSLVRTLPGRTDIYYFSFICSLNFLKIS